MAYNESNERTTKSCCEKIHEAIFGKPNRKNDVQNRYDYPTVKPHVSSTPFHSVPHEVKISEHLVHFSSNNVEKNGNDGGGKAFSEEEYNSYIDGMKMKMKMGASSNVGGEPKVSRGEPKVSRDDSFNDTVSSFIGRTKLKLVARPSVSDVGRTLEPYN